MTVPATIHDIIAARIDRIAEPLKQTLQGAAVVGRRFGISLVSRVLQVVPDQVAGHLRDLHALDFVFPSAQDPELMYSFKHALTQDVVYAGVLERRRRRYHAAAGLGLEELYAGQIDEVVELIAYHYGRGQVWDKAATYLRQAAVKAQGRSAHREALASLEEALEALRHLPETPETREQEIDVRLETPGLALLARRVREDADLPARSGGHGQRHLRFPPARVGLHPHVPNTSARRGGLPRRERLPSKRWPWATSCRTSRSSSTRAITLASPAMPSATTGVPRSCCGPSRSRRRSNGGRARSAAR